MRATLGALLLCLIAFAPECAEGATATTCTASSQ